jgi:endonuclease G
MLRLTALRKTDRSHGRTLAAPAAVLDRLRRVLAATRRARGAGQVTDRLGERSGYDPDFLGPTVGHPDLGCLADAVAPVAGTDDGMLRYTHYAVRMHRFRRLAIYTAVNIDGGAVRAVPREDDWRLDPRLDRRFQIGNELYRRNDLDRGHLVRRLDPAWGDTLEDARDAARDTFFYTNCAPQHRLHNQQLWLGLEDHILDSARVHGLRVSVFTGPVLRADDRIYRGIKIPEDFWKVVAIVDSATDRLSVTGYVVSQRDYIDDLRFAFGPYETYQVPVATIEAQTGLSFGLAAFDPMHAADARPARRLTHPTDIVL